jgi:uncharacterized protein (TIGR03435 family)
MSEAVVRKVCCGRGRLVGVCTQIVFVVAALVGAVPEAGWAQAAVAVHERGDVTGDWQGTLEIPGSGGRTSSKYRIVLRIAKSADGLSALNYVIDQSPTPMKTAGVTLRGMTFQYSIPAMNGSYAGELSADGKSIVGEWTQGRALPLVFMRATKETAWEIPKPLPPLKPMAADADPSFEVATLKPSLLDGGGKVLRVMGRRYVTHNTSLADLIEVAYGVHPRQIKGAPAWVEEDKFDLVGVPDAEGEPNARQWLTMMQKLLADRFKLTFHHDKQEVSAFVISVGKNGPKNLTKNESGNALPSGLEFRPVAGGVLLPAGNTSMSTLAQMMQQVVLDRPVIDKTGLAGRFDFGFTFTPDDSEFEGHPPRLPAQTNASPGLFEAMQQQLGLKLSAETAPAEVLVIDHVERPSAN